MKDFAALYDPPSAKVRVGFVGSGLEIRDDDGLLIAHWVYADLRPVGALRPGQALVLTCTSDPAGRLTLIDSAILEPLRLRAPQAVQSAEKGDGLLSGCAMGTLAGCGGGCLLLVGIPLVILLGLLAWIGLPAWLDDRPWPHHMADRMMTWMEPTLDEGLPPVCTGEAGQDALTHLAGRLADGGGLEVAPTVRVLDEDEPLAFPMGTRRLYVTRGLIDRLEDADALSGVLAHVMGHAAQADYLAVEAVEHAGGWRLSVPSCTAEADELEADAWALRALRRAGLDSGGLLRHVDRLPRGMVGPWGDQLCLHPVTDERLRALRLSVTEGGASALSPAQWQDVRGICGAE